MTGHVLAVIIPPLALAVLLAYSLCRAAAKPVPPIRAKAQEGHARLELYGGRRQDVSSVCASKPGVGECPLFLGGDDE